MDLGEYSLTRIEAPEDDVATLAEVKRHCNVVTTDEDALLTHYLAAATDQLERDANLACLTQTWRLRRHAWPAERTLILPRYPLQEVTEVRYVDLDGDTQVWPDANYVVDTDRRPGLIWLAAGANWPSDTDGEVPNGIEVEFTAGWADAADVPVRAKQAILLLIGHWYRSRESVIVGTISEALPHAYDALVASLRGATYP